MRRLRPAAPQRRRRGAAAAAHRRLGRRFALPIALAVGLGGAAALGLLPPVQGIGRTLQSWLLGRTAVLGLRVVDIRVEGRTTTDRRLPDTLYVRLVEKRPLALWQHDGRLQLIDDTGAVIPVPRLDRFAKLPLVVGADAASHAADLLAMLAKEPDLAARVTAAVRVGGRRWNLRLDGRIDVLLPADDAATAWAALAHLERSSAILEREVEAIDLRLPDRLVVRLLPQPPKAAAPASNKSRTAAKNT
jgi:hypothetical protein